MCLDIYDIENPTSTDGIETSKDGKFFVGYKALELQQLGTDAFELRSPYCYFVWGIAKKKTKKTKHGKETIISLTKEAKQLHISDRANRKNTSLSRDEIRRGAVDKGFHFYVHQMDAVMDNGDDFVIVKCFIPKDKFVAQGDFGCPSFVATETRISSIAKQPTEWPEN